MKRTIKKPAFKILSVVLMAITIFGVCFFAANATDWNVDGSGNDNTKPGIEVAEYFNVRNQDNAQKACVGYRFSMINKYGNTVRITDWYRNNDVFTKSKLAESYRLSTKYSKAELRSNWNVKFDPTTSTTGCAIEHQASNGKWYVGLYKDSGYNDTVLITEQIPNPVEGDDNPIVDWLNDKNINAICRLMGYSGSSALGLGDRIMVEPIWRLNLQGYTFTLTLAEICVYGIKAAKSGTIKNFHETNGGYNLNEMATCGGGPPDAGYSFPTIARFTNYVWPNALIIRTEDSIRNVSGYGFVIDKESKGWNVNISNSNYDDKFYTRGKNGVVPRKSFYSILCQGYGAAIVYANEEAQKVVVKYSTGNDEGKATVTSPYKKSGNIKYALIYKNSDVYTQTIKYGEGVTLASPSTFGLALTGHEFHHWDGNGGYFSSGVYLTYDTALQFATKTASGGYELVLDAQWKAKNYTVNYYAVFDDSPAEHWLSYNATIGRTYYHIEIPDYLGFEKVDGKWHKGNTTSSTKYTPGASFTDLTTAGSTVNLYTAYKSKSYTIEFYKVLNGTTTYVDKISNKSYTSASFNLKDLPSKPTGYSNYIGWYDGDGELYSISEGKRVINNHQNESIIKLYAYSDAELYKITCNKNLPTKYDGKLGYITEGSDYYYEQYSTAYREKNSVTSASVEKITPPSIYGYTFDGYYTTSAATGGYKVVDSDGTLVKNINSKGNYKYFTADTTVYARWTKISYTATFNPGSNGKWSDGSTTNKTQTYTIDSVLNAKNTPTNTISTKKFTGWKVTTAAGNWFLNTIYENNYLVNKAGMYGNVTFTAQYETTVSTLAVDPNGGTWRNTSIITRIKGVKNQTVSIENPKRTGYSFDGWDLDLAQTASYNSANKTFKFGDPGPDSTHLSTLTANWTNNIYTINMDFANGINSKEISTKGTTVIYEKYSVAYYAENTAKTRITKITVPTASGYTFGGYYNTPDCKGTLVVDASGTIKTASTFFNSDATIYAKWTPKIFTITCNKNGGTGGTSKFYEKYGEGFYSDSACKNKITNILLPTKTNYFFLYYTYETDTAIDLVVFDENMKTNGKIIVDNTYFTKDSTIDASWVENNVLVLYRTNKKSTDETFVFKNSDYGEKDLTKVDSFERLSFGMKIILFTGMYDIEYDKLTSVDDYIAYKDDAVLDGSIYWSSDKTGKNLLSNATKSKMYSDKYEFVGWNTKADGSGKSFTDGQKVTAKDLYPDVVTDHAVITLYAQWKPKTFTVNYKWTDGTKAAEPTTYVYGKGGTLAAVPTVSYHSVDGWFTDASCAAKAANPSKTDFGDITVYAVKTPNRYTISYRWADDPDTNIPGMYPNGYDYGVGATLADVPAVTNYVTSGWYTAKECKTKASNPSATSHANVIVYAKKTPANFDITYKYVLPDGTVKPYSSITPKTYTYGTGAKLGAAKNPDSTKYALVDGKWYTTDACTGTNVTEIKASEGGDRTYYTKLKYATFNIYYYLDKTLKKTETYTYGTGKSSLYSLAAEAGHTNAPAANATWYVGTSATAYSTSSTATSIAKDATGNKYFHKTSKTNNLYISFWVNKDNSTMSSTTYQFIGSGTIATKDGKTYYQTQPYNDAFKLNTMKTFGITRTNYKLGNWVMFFTNGDGKGVNTAIKYSTSTSLTPAKVSTDLMNYLKTHSGVTAKNGSDITKENVYVYMAPEWVAHSATLKVDPNGGTWNEKSTVQSITQNFSTKLSVPKAVGKTVTATFNGNGGTSEKANQKGALPFKTWTKSSTFYGTMSSLTADATYTYPTNDGVTSTITASYNPLTVTFPNATRSGYKLLGWADSSSATTAKYAVGSTTTITANQTFYAVWQIEYTATMNHWLTGLKNGEGTNSSKTSIKIASTSKTFTSGKNNLTIAAADILTTLPNGVRKRPATGTYTIGTYLDDSTGKQGSAWKTYNLNKTFSNVSYNPTFQFNYELIPYTITYDYNGGKAPATANPPTYNVVYGASFKNAPTRAGYTFDGWVVKGTTTKITGFNETALASTAFADSNTVSASAFTAAVKSRTTGNKTVVAQWKANTIKVYYNANGGICAAPSHKGSTTYYHAVGTDGLMRFSTSSSVTASSAAYYSTYTYKSGDHNPYNADGAFGLSKTGYNAAKQYMINSSTGTAYGQDDGASIAAALDKQIENGKTSATLYVKWTPITYKIRYNLNGGALKNAYDTVYTNSSGSKYPQNPTSLTYGSTYGLIELPTKTGFTFNGWTISQMTNSTHRYWSSADKASTFTGTSVANTDKLAKVQFFGDLRNVQDNPDVTTDDVVFTANWTPITYTIKYDLGGGSFLNELNSQYTQGSYKYYRNPTSMKYYGTAEAGFNKYFNVEIPSRTGYIFNGWTVTKLDDSTHNIWYNGAGHTSTATSWANTSSEGKAQMFYNLRSTSGEVLFTANWTPITYTVEYYFNGAKQTSLTQTCNYGTSYTYKAFPNATAGNHYTKTGWSAKTDMSGTLYNPGASFKNLTTTDKDTIKRYITTEANTVTLTLKKNNANWNSANTDGLTTIRLTNKNDTSKYTEVTTSNNKSVYAFSGIANGTYVVYVPLTTGGKISSSESYFKTIVVDNNNVSKDLDYYSVTVTGDEGISSVAGGINWIVKGGTRNLSKTVKAGYAWNKWTGTKDGTAITSTDEKYSISKIANEWVMKANTVKKTITVKYHSNGGTVNSASHKSGSTTYYHAIGSDKLMRYSTSSAVTGTSPVYSASYTYKSSSFNPVNQSTFTLNKTGYKASEFYTIGSTGTVKYSSDPNTEIAAAFDALIEKGETEVVLYPVWNANTYTVEYYVDGTKQTALTQTCSYPTSYTYAALPAAPTGKHYVAENWNAKSDLTGTTYKAGVSFSKLSATNDTVISLYAKTEDNASGTITYRWREGGVDKGEISGVTPSTYKQGVATTLGKIPALTGYTVTNQGTNKWYTGLTGTTVKQTIAATETGNKTVYADRVANTYTVEYYVDGTKQTSLTQTCSYPTSYNYKALPAVAAGKHYIADNWNTKDDLSGTTYAAGASFSKLSATNDTVISLYAKTEDNASGTITYRWREGGVDKGEISGVTPTTYKQGVATALGKIPALTGYTVTNQGTNKWYTGLTGTTVKQTIAATETGNKTVYADRKANTYTVEYYVDGTKQASLTQTCSYPTSYTYAALPTAPAGKHYVAENWNIKSDLTGTTYKVGASFSKLSATNGAVVKLYANTIDNTSGTITYRWREGGVDKGVITGVTPAKYTEGIATTLGNIPALTGYTVTNQGTNKWYTGLTGTTVKQTIAATETGNKTVYADRVANTYTITYKWSDGTTISGLTPTTFKYGVGATLAAVPAVTGYTTNGWYTSAACTTKASNPSATTAENITVYASKVAKTITVKYHVNGGTVSSASHKSGSTTYYHAVGSDNLMRYSSTSAVTASSAVYTKTYTYKSGTFDPINHSTFALTKTGYTGAELYTIDGTTGTTYGTASNTAIATAFDALIESGKTTVVLYPVWTANTYTIKYVVDGVEKTNLTQTATYDVNVNLASYSESKRYVTNWYTARNASTTVLSGSTYAHGATVKNLTATKNGTVTLYAKTYVIVRFTNGTGALAGTNLISGTSTPTYEFKARSGYSNVYLYNNTSKAFTDINAYKETGLVKSLLLSGGDTGLTNARAGYQFDNWNTNTSGTGTTFKKESSGAYTFDQIAAFANSNGNVPLYAKWVINPSTLTVNPNGGTWNGSTETQTFTQSYNTTKAIPVPTGATVKATFNGNGGSTPEAVSGQRPFSKWTRTNTYGTMSSLTTDAIYTFGSTYGVTDTLTAGYGSVSVTFPTSTRTGYILQGWADSSTATTKKYDVGSTTNLTANKTFYAVWTPITYTVKYNGNGATGGSTANSTHTYDVAKNLTTNGFVRQYTVTYLDESNKTLTYPASATTANATWNGWAKTATGTVAYGPTQPISVKNLTATNGATITLYAKWTLASITLPTPPAKEGYVPTGWVPADDPTSTPQAPGTTVTPTKDITYIPKYTPITYTVKYNGNGATGGSTANSTHTYDVAKNLTTNGFVRKYTVTYKDAEGVKITTYPASATTANATWNGWAKTATGTVAYGPTQPISVKNLTKTNGAVITLYAKWTLASVTLPPLPEIPGYEPEGWVPENDPTKDPENPGDVITPTEDIIFVPKYSPKTITVKYHANGGSVSAASHTSGTTTYYHALGSDKLLRYSTVSAVTASSAVFTTKYAYGTGTFDPINEASFGLSRTGYAVAEKYTIGSNGTVKYSTSKNTAIADAFDELILNGDKEVVLYAVWTPNIYYVKYNGNGATAGSMSNSTYTYDKQGVLDKNKFTRQYTVTYKNINNKVITTYPTDATQAAATFKGWAKTAAGDVVYANQYNNVLNWTATNKGTVNIYAKWELASITLPELPVVPGYEPEGWVPEDDPTKDPEKPGDVITPEEDETYVGKYKPITYTLTYNTNGGKWADNTTANKTKSFIVTDNITLRNDLSKEGYILTGWKVTSASTGSWKKNTTYKEDQNLGKGHYGNVTLTAVWVKQLYLKAIVPNADYSLNTDVISSFRLYNPTDSDRIPSSHVNLTFIVRDGSKVITTKVLENVVVPKGDSQLVWIKWTVPAVVNNNINIEAYIHEDLIEDDFGNITTVYKTAAIEESYPTPFNPDPTRPVREGWTRDSVPGTPTCVDTVSSTWDVWEYVNGAFVKKTYGITATGTATIRPDAYAQTDANGNTLLVVICPNCGTENLLGSNACRKCSNSLPDDLMVCTKSGYGIVLQAQTSVSAASGATLANANDYTGAQTALELRPEYLYEKTTTDEKYIAMKGTDKVFVTLEKVGDVFMFVEDAEAVQNNDEDTRYINTEMWYATGMKGFDAVTYAALVEFSDFWTPNGMITVNATSNELGMSGTILDDSVNY